MNQNQDVIRKSHPHVLGYLRFYFSGILFAVIGGVAIVYQYTTPGIGIIIFGILIFCLGEILRNARTFYILESGVANGWDLFSTSRKFAEYRNIQNIAVSQSFLEKILGIGSISFDTSGGDAIEVHFEGVVDPYGIEQIVRQKMSIE